MSRDAFVCFPRFFLPFRSTRSSGRGGGASGRAFGVCELASVSSVHSWTGDTGVALLQRTPATFFMSRLALPPHLCTFDEVMGWESRRGSFLPCSRLSLPPHLCTLSELVRRVRLPSAAPVSFPPWPPDLRLERQGGYLSAPLVEWLLLAVLLLALSPCLPCSVKRSSRCELGSRLFSLVRSLGDRWQPTDR